MYILYLLVLLKPVSEIGIDPDFTPHRMVSLRNKLILFDPAKSYFLRFDTEEFKVDTLSLEGDFKNILSIASDGLKIYILSTDEILVYDRDGGYLGKETSESYSDFDLFPPDGFLFLERGSNYLIIKARNELYRQELLFRAEHVRYFPDSRYFIFGSNGIGVYEIPGILIKELDIPVRDVLFYREWVLLLSGDRLYIWDFDKLEFHQLPNIYSSLHIYGEKLILGGKGRLDIFNLTDLLSSPTR
jgi:hypothetical protein